MTDELISKLVNCPDCPAYVMLGYHKCGDCGHDFDKWEGWTT